MTAEEMARLIAEDELHNARLDAAQGGEARQGGDACGSVHEHPVAEGHAPNSCPSHPINTQGESAS